MHQLHDNFLGVKSNPTIFFANSSSFEMVRSFTCSSRVKVLSVGRLGLNDHFSILPDHFIFNLLLKRYGPNDPVLTFRPFDLATFWPVPQGCRFSQLADREGSSARDLLHNITTDDTNHILCVIGKIQCTMYDCNCKQIIWLEDKMQMQLTNAPIWDTAHIERASSESSFCSTNINSCNMEWWTFFSLSKSVQFCSE